MSAFTDEVAGRFGMLPNFFCSASAAPGLIEELWAFARSAYLDSPLPSLFKERLFVHLSRFCEIRYCIVRHVGFLIGQGHPAGDPDAEPEMIEQVVALLSRPLPDAAALDTALTRLQAYEQPANIPDPRTRAEADLFDALTVIFVEPCRSARAREAVRRAFGKARSEILTAYLAFIRTAHYWTETHPELAFEPDMLATMERFGDLARLLLDPSDAQRVWSREQLRRALDELHRTQDMLRESKARLAADLAGMRRLYELHAKLANETDLHVALSTILAVAVEFVGTDRGTVQLVSEDGERLEIIAHHGYGWGTGFTEYFLKGGSKPACDAARRLRQRLIIEDVETFPALLGTKDREVALADGIRATQSTPMISRKGELVGVLSTQFPRPHRPSDHELRLIDLLAWTAADFVERHRASAALRASEARFRALVTATSYAVYRMGPDWTEMRQLDGRGFLSDTNSPSKTWLAEYIHPDDQAQVWEVIQEAIRTKSVFELEHRVRRMNDSLGWTLSRAVPLLGPDGEIMEWFGAASDVTDRKRSEEALRASEARFRTLMEGIPQLVWRAVDGGDWTWASPQWAAYTGQPEPESRDQGWLKAVHPEDCEPVMAAWRKAESKGAFRADHRLRHANEGRWRWVQSQATPVRGDTGHIVEWLGTTTDVEDLRRAHEQEILIAELQHRTRNLLTVVSGIAEQTLAASTSLDEFGTRFDQRLATIGRVQGLLSRGTEPNVTIDELVRLELAAHGVDPGAAERIRFSGPSLVLPARVVQLLALALHELMTNAMKYGALRNHRPGRLDIAWQERSGPGTRPRLRLDWAESGVAMAADPSAARRGFGLDLIEFTLPYELDGKTQLAFTAEGVRCAIELPLDKGLVT